jgi:hypothetical protein
LSRIQAFPGGHLVAITRGYSFPMIVGEARRLHPHGYLFAHFGTAATRF